MCDNVAVVLNVFADLALLLQALLREGLGGGGGGAGRSLIHRLNVDDESVVARLAPRGHIKSLIILSRFQPIHILRHCCGSNTVENGTLRLDEGGVALGDGGVG